MPSFSSPLSNADPALPAMGEGAAPPSEMRAVCQSRYGGPEALGVERLPIPEAAPLRIEVRAVSITRADWHVMTGKPFLIRAAGFGVTRPKQRTPGQYVAGVVDAVTPAAEKFRVGDAVFGFVPGGCGEYVAAEEEQLAPLPNGVSPAAAVSALHGGFAALQALRDAAKMRAGERVLIIGGAGAVGSVAIQIAKGMGAHVSAVCLAPEAEFTARQGADRVWIDGREDFTREGEQFDVVLDMVRHRRDRDLRRCLRPGGRVIMVSGGSGRIFGGMDRVLLSAFKSLFSGKKFRPFLAVSKMEDLEELGRLLQAKTLRPEVAASFGLDEAAAAFRFVVDPRACGLATVSPGA